MNHPPASVSSSLLTLFGRYSNSVLLFVELSLKVVPRNEVEGSICQLGVDSIKLIQVSHGSFIAATMTVGLIRTRNHHVHTFVDLIQG